MKNDILPDNLKAWIIIDDKTGNANQAKAIVKALKCEYQVKNICYNFLSFLPNRLKFNSLIGVDLLHSDKINPPFPDIIISSGRKTAAVNGYIKSKNPGVFSVHIMNPNLNFDIFDLVCLPEHDNYSGKKDNVISTIGAPCYLDKYEIEKAGKILDEKFKNLPKPFICLMIGGKTKYGKYSDEEIIWLLKKAQELAKSVNGTLLITTSRRSDKSVADLILNEIKISYYLYDWHSSKDQYNPYLGFLALSDYFIITGDSISICSEVLSTGKPVYIYQKNNLLSKKHRKFLAYLEKLGYTKTLNEQSILKSWTYSPLSEAERVAKIIKEKMHANINFSG